MTENIKMKKNPPSNARKKGVKFIVLGIIIWLLFILYMDFYPRSYEDFTDFDDFVLLIFIMIFMYGNVIIVSGLQSLVTGKFNEFITTPVKFCADNVKGKAPLKVQFTDNTNFETIKKKWAFGDGETSIEDNPIHIYTKSGKYSVSLELLFTDNNIYDKIEKNFIKVK